MGTGYNNSERPNVVPGVSCRNSGGPITSWFNAKAWTLDHYVLGSLPTSPRGVCAGPGIANTDFSIDKNFKLTERVTMKFSVDFFNFFNKTQFRGDSINTSFSNTGVTCYTTTPTSTGDAHSINNANGPCFGYALNTLAWNPLVSSGLVQGNFGQLTNDRGPRELQYGLKIDF
jgi:hypothetical protein